MVRITMMTAKASFSERLRGRLTFDMDLVLCPGTTWSAFAESLSSDAARRGGRAELVDSKTLALAHDPGQSGWHPVIRAIREVRLRVGADGTQVSCHAVFAPEQLTLILTCFMPLMLVSMAVMVPLTRGLKGVLALGMLLPMGAVVWGVFPWFAYPLLHKAALLRYLTLFGVEKAKARAIG